MACNPEDGTMVLLEIDERFMHINDVIDEKRQMLMDKQHKLKKIVKKNVFLEEIKGDYLEYYNYIMKQKQDQMDALNLLNNYINELNEKNKLSKYNIEDAKMEQDKIMKEINEIQSGLNGIMKNTNELGKTINSKTINHKYINNIY